MNIYKYAPCQGCFFSPEYIPFKILKSEKGLMLINLPDALILQKKKPIKNTTKKFYMDILAYPGIPRLNPKSLSPVEQISSVVLCQSHKVNLPFLSACVLSLSPSSADTHRHHKEV